MIDPFAGSCVTGEVSERLGRRWLCIELIQDYLQGALGRFQRDPAANGKSQADPKDEANYYRIPRPGILWDDKDDNLLLLDSGKDRQLKEKRAANNPVIALARVESGKKTQFEMLLSQNESME